MCCWILPVTHPSSLLLIAPLGSEQDFFFFSLQIDGSWLKFGREGKGQGGLAAQVLQPFLEGEEKKIPFAHLKQFTQGFLHPCAAIQRPDPQQRVCSGRGSKPHAFPGDSSELLYTNVWVH